MSERRMATVIRQQAQLHAVLSIDPTDNYDFPNIKLLEDATTDEPPEEHQLTIDQQNRLAVHFCHMDHQMYQNYWKLVHEGIGSLTVDNLKSAIRGLARITKQVSALAGQPVPASPVRAFTPYMKQLAAMQLVLYMVDVAGTMKNLDYVKTRPDDTPADPGKISSSDRDWLIDTFGLFDFNLYSAFYTLLTAGSGEKEDPVDFAEVERTMKSLSTISAVTSADLAIPYVPWDGTYPHPCSLVNREVVTHLLMPESINGDS